MSALLKTFVKLVVVVALLIAAAIAGLLARLTAVEAPTEGASCTEFGRVHRSALGAELTCIEMWSPVEGKTGRGIWSTGNVDGKFRP